MLILPVGHLNGWLHSIALDERRWCLPCLLAYTYGKHLPDGVSVAVRMMQFGLREVLRYKKSESESNALRGDI